MSNTFGSSQIAKDSSSPLPSIDLWWKKWKIWHPLRYVHPQSSRAKCFLSKSEPSVLLTHPCYLSFLHSQKKGKQESDPILMGGLDNTTAVQKRLSHLIVLGCCSPQGGFCVVPWKSASPNQPLVLTLTWHMEMSLTKPLSSKQC
jgi:hypothetical protein